MTQQAPAKAMQEKRRKAAGFTLIELMVVIVIIGLLSAIVVVNVLPQQDQAMQQKVRADVRNLEQALSMYKLNMLSFPSTDQGLEALVSAPPSLRNPERYPNGGFIKGLPKDPWGNDYQYIFPGERGDFDLYSLGADGRLGGEGENADIGNWTPENQ